MAEGDNIPENPETFEKLNDYTLSVTTDFGRMHKADPELRRIFNFAAQDITTIYSMWYSTAVSASLHVQKFSELDSLDEVEMMHAKLCEMGGKPPALPQGEKLGKPALRTPQNSR